jgi:hypothetical protein
VDQHERSEYSQVFYMQRQTEGNREKGPDKRTRVTTLEELA